MAIAIERPKNLWLGGKCTPKIAADEVPRTAIKREGKSITENLLADSFSLVISFLDNISEFC